MTTTTTTNYGWTIPNDSELVKDGAAAIRTLGNAADASLKTVSDAAVTKATFTTKGDILTTTAASTIARLGVGTDGQVLTADSASAGGVKWNSVSSGGMTLLSTTTLSGTSTVISGISQSYTNLYVLLQNIYYSASTVCKVNPNGTGINGSYVDQGTGGMSAGLGSSSSGTSASAYNNFVYIINNYADTTYGKPIYFSGGLGGGMLVGGSIYPYATAISSLTITSTSGTATFGTGARALIYGVK
jgi:hypothetical protein